MKLYTIGCPKCAILEKKLKSKNIDFEICTDTNIMSQLGIDSLPVLGIGNNLLPYKEAVNYINNYNQEA